MILKSMKKCVGNFFPKIMGKLFLLQENKDIILFFSPDFFIFLILCFDRRSYIVFQAGLELMLVVQIDLKLVEILLCLPPK